MLVFLEEGEESLFASRFVLSYDEHHNQLLLHDASEEGREPTRFDLGAWELFRPDYDVQITSRKGTTWKRVTEGVQLDPKTFKPRDQGPQVVFKSIDPNDSAHHR